MQPFTTSNASATEAYRRQGILTASPIELIIMLFDGLKKDLLLAKMGIEKGKHEVVHKKLINAQEIVAELINSLDLNFPISNELLELYEFIIWQIQDINVKKDAALIPDLVEIVDTLRQTWQEVAEAQKGSGQQLYLQES